MKTEIIATGTELLLDQTLNTSTHYITTKLSALGFEVDYHTTVGDNSERLENVLRHALQRADLVVTIRGIGPTQFDLSKELVAKVLGFKMILDTTSLSNENKAYFPKDAKIFANQFGTAPGALIQRNGKFVVILPGPPFEMQPMFEDQVLPELERLIGLGRKKTKVRVLKVFGMGESALEVVLGDLMDQTFPTLALLAKRTEIHIQLVARSVDQFQAQKVLDSTETIIRSRLGNKVFGRDEETLVSIVGEALRRHKLTIATAESCTGGLLGGALTQEPGSSDYYLGGVISYANTVKESLLDVNSSTLQRVGAVSAEVAIEMAKGIRFQVGANLALATTGIAGPDGGSDSKPVGLVYIGFASVDGVEARKFQFYGGRKSIRQLAVAAAFDWVRKYMLEFERGSQ